MALWLNLLKSNPNIKAFVTDKNKWYALILDVEYNKLNKESPIESKVKIINLKHNTDHIPMIINDNEDINIDKVTSEIVECLSFALVTEK